MGTPFLKQADRVGFAASFLCAVHCALLPLLAAALPAFGLGLWGRVDLDQAFVVFATLLGVSTLVSGWRRHRAFHAWALLVPGLALVWLGTFTVLLPRHCLLTPANSFSPVRRGETRLQSKLSLEKVLEDYVGVRVGQARLRGGQAHPARPVLKISEEPREPGL